MEKAKQLVMNFLKEEEGVTAIEYSLIAALIAVGIITATGALGDKISGTFNAVANEMP